MPRYNQIKYNKGKYGRYEIEIGTEIPLQNIKRYRLRTIDSNKHESKSIVNHGAYINKTGGPVKVRLKSNDGPWVYNQTAQIKGSPSKIRIKAMGKEESEWIECVIGTIRKA